MTSRSAGTLSGVEALVRLLVLRHELDARAGLDTATMVSGYPGSPLGGFDLALEAQAALLGEHRVVHRPGVNEELAAATVWGSQMGRAVEYAGVDGVAGAWYGKTPGLDRSGDVLRHANAMGAGPNGGFVLFCGDDPVAKSSTLPCDSQYTFQDACIPVLYPADQQDVLDLGVHAFRMSRLAGPLVGLKIVTAVADGASTVDLSVERHAASVVPEIVVDGRAWRHEPLATIGPHQVPDQELLVVHHRLAAAKAYVRANGLDRVVGAPLGAPVGIVCAGTTYHDVVQAFADLGVGVHDLAGLGVRVLKLAMTYPLVDETIIEFARSVDELVVIEEKRPFIETQLRAIVHEAGVATRVLGKRDREGNALVSSVGALGAGDVAAVLTRVLPLLAGRLAPKARTLLPVLQIPPRPPAFCSGCPHNRSTVVPAGALAGGGVGCHGIMYFEERQRDTHKLPPPPMGAEGVPWIGLAPFVGEPHLFQNLGDGTLSHSGILAIRASVAAGVNTTFKILYNAAVAMTGGQDVTGLLDVPALTRALEAEGVRRVIVCAEEPKRYGRRARWAPGVEVHGRDDLADVQERLRDVPGVTVIVYDQRCAAEARRLRKRGQLPTPPARVVINEAVCEGCGDCVVKSNCASVVPHATEFGEKRRVDDPTCNRDYTCLEGDCPSFVTLTPRRVHGSPRSARATERVRLPVGTLPVPVPAVVEGQFGVYFTGIGGTGVVTAMRLLSAAADAAGFVVGGMDQTGLSQKAGAVVSHLHLARDRAALGAATVGSQGADLYLSGDILQAAGAVHLDRIRTDRTVAVVDSEVTPTAAMLQGGTAVPDTSALRAAVTDRVGAGRVAFVDSKRIADAVFADPVLANVVLLGTAFQLGGLPLTAAHLDTAFSRQGPAAARNRAAFEWGRWVAHDLAAVETALAAAHPQAATGPFEPSPSAHTRAAALVAGRAVPAALAELLTRRAAQVIEYQHAALAERYLGLVARAAAHDDDAHSWRLTTAVAEQWFHLLTYKDEYEVARLHAGTDYAAVAAELGIEGGYTVRYHLHPPALRRLGMRRKLPLGRPYAASFAVLRRMKRLRGTPLDVFGWDRDRRLERAVIREYEQLVSAALGVRPYDDVVAIAASAAMVRGYGPVKERTVAAWREEVART